MNLNQVTVPSLDVDRSIDFYLKLGMKLVVKAPPHYARFELPEGDATFSVHKVEQMPSGDRVMVYFEKDDLDAWVGELQARGVAFDELPEDRPWLWREARLKDPDGNPLVLFYGGDNRKNPPWRV